VTIKVTICDDSKLARKMMAGSLPDAWDVEISFAENGKEGIEQIQAGNADLMFLDLNMPVMDGYQVLEAIRKNDLPCMVIVVSGDIQPQARERVVSLGALDFIKKPIDNEKLSAILVKFGIFSGDSKPSNVTQLPVSNKSSLEDKLDAVQELANLAMGRAGESLAKLLNKFIGLPVPRVTLLHPNELQMALLQGYNNEKISAVSKGFVSSGLSGEAIIMFDDRNSEAISRLLGYTKQTDTTGLESLMDVGNIIIGTCLNALSSALRLELSYSSPIILGMHCDASTMVKGGLSVSEVLMIEIDYSIPDADVSFELLLLIPKQYLDGMYIKMTNTEVA
jgi:CheY-like chemotaxis protein